jgi:[acyl-carrier-protein] S-malonyltransferase
VRALVVFPGRGSYGPTELGTLGRAPTDVRDQVVAAIDAPRAERGLSSVLDLDARPKFDPAVHLPGENASALIVACGLVDHLLLERAGVQVVGVTGNSLGFYTALVAAGVLSLEDGARLVDGMAALQVELGSGGQLIYPLTDPETWRKDPARVAAVEAALGATEGAHRSVELAAFSVLAGDDAALAALEARLPKVAHGGRTYPFRLQHHLAFHTPLVASVAEAARERIQLEWRAPKTQLVLGNGALASPWSTDPRELAAYTLGEQVVTPFQVATAVRVGLRELAPDVVILAGPGESIGGAIGAVMVEEGWRGIRSKDQFLARQKESPVLLALGRPEQRALALAKVEAKSS